jgi:cell division protein FtsB
MKILMVVLLILLAWLQFTFWFGQGSVSSLIRLKRQVAEQKVIDEQLTQRNQVLMAEVEDLKSGHDAVEEHARDDLGMIKQNEKFYQIVK